MAMAAQPAVWFPAVRAGSGTDRFTEALVEALRRSGIQAALDWLPHRAEVLPWSVSAPRPPAWANVVHVNSWLHPRFLPTGLPVLATIHSCVHDPAAAPFKTRAQACYHRCWVRRLERRGLQRADRVVAVSRYTAERSRKVFGGEIAVVPNGVDAERFHPTERADPGQPFRLLFVGNCSVRKGFDLLSPVMQSLGEGFELHYTGGGQGGADLPANCRDIGRLGGERLVDAYRQADALLFPTRLEGLPLAVLEAMACGLPVVTTRAASLPEVVTHGREGWTCTPDSVSELVAACRALRSDPARWRAMRAAARRRIEAEFTLDLMRDRYLEFYRALLADR